MYWKFKMQCVNVYINERHPVNQLKIEQQKITCWFSASIKSDYGINNVIVKSIKQCQNFWNYRKCIKGK